MQCDRIKDEATFERHIKGEAVRIIHEDVLDASELSKKATRVDPATIGTDTGTSCTKRWASIASKPLELSSEVCRVNLLLRISIFVKDLASFDVSTIPRPSA